MQHRAGSSRRAAHPDARLAVVGGEHAGEGPVRHDELGAVPGRPGVVGVVGGAVGVPGYIDGRADRAGDAGVQPVGTHDEPGVELERRTGRVTGGHPDNAAGLRSKAGHRDAEANAGPRGLGGVGDDRVQHAAARGNQEVHAGVLLHLARDRFTPGVEGHLADRRCATGEDPIEQAPTGELDDATTRDGVRRERVARELRTLQHGNVVAHPSQEQSGRTSCCTCPDHDDVVVAALAGGHRDRSSWWLTACSATLTDSGAATLETAWGARGDFP
jgi:hypothetical protein